MLHAQKPCCYTMLRFCGSFTATCTCAGSNVAGSLLGCREAVRLMRQQPPHPRPAYHIFNLGFSRWGASLSRSACTHKATKSALTQLTQSLSEELREAGAGPNSCSVHALTGKRCRMCMRRICMAAKISLN